MKFGVALARNVACVANPKLQLLWNPIIDGSDMRKEIQAALIVLGAFGCCTAPGQSPPAQSSGSQPAATSAKCPVSFEQVDVRYNHAGGESVPQLRLAFTNRTDKTIAGFVFSLSILDPNGNPIPYPSQLEYRREFPPSPQQRSRLWSLDKASVDMHRSGETVTLLETTFADGTTWKDDGSQACTLAFDYHAK